MPTPTGMASVFTRVRMAVLQEATRPTPYDATLHRENQRLFRNQLKELIRGAKLQPEMSAGELWRHVWTKIRYAGFKAAYVTKEIERLDPFFSDFRMLVAPDWFFDPHKRNHGLAVQQFLRKEGRFKNISYSKLGPKLEKILRSAAAFQSIPEGASALTAIFGPNYAAQFNDDNAFWRAHGALASLVGFTTALHIMMDIGFECVKPDVWLVRLMCRLGWIEDVLPVNSSEETIKGDYRKPEVAKAVIRAARQIVADLRQQGENASLREIDFVLVKYGQKPGEFGIVRSLHDQWRGIGSIMEWQPSE